MNSLLRPETVSKLWTSRIGTPSQKACPCKRQKYLTNFKAPIEALNSSEITEKQHFVVSGSCSQLTSMNTYWKRITILYSRNHKMEALIFSLCSIWLLLLSAARSQVHESIYKCVLVGLRKQTMTSIKTRNWKIVCCDVNQ